MNYSTDSQEPSNGYYVGNTPVYNNTNFTSSFTPNTNNTYARHSYVPSANEQYGLLDMPRRNTLNQDYLSMSNFREQPQIPQQTQSEYLASFRPDFDNGETTSSSSSIAYYNRIHAQVHSHTPSTTYGDSAAPVASFQPSTQSTYPMTINNPSQGNFLQQLSSPAIPTQAPSPLLAPLNDYASSTLSNNDDDPPLDYAHYTIDALIQRLIPTDSYIPKQTFIYSMLLCSRMHIQPTILLNKLAYLTISSIRYITRDRSIRTMNNFLYVLSQWTRAFPYDFRNTDMMSQLEEIFQKLNAYESSFQADTYYIHRKLLSKLKALENYEEYIQQLNTKALNSLTHTALLTDIVNECPTPLLFAQQLTHIELDRLKPIGAEELIQYFIMKLSFEEARAHPNRTQNNPMNASTERPLEYVHDKKLTSCLETYVQWSNRLTFFVTTEIVKHTQRRLRIRLINYFIDAAYECFRLHNFNSMMGIIGGLEMQPVKRLRRTWEKVQSEKLNQLQQYMNVSKNFSAYRSIFKAALSEAEKCGWSVDKIVIPFASIVLQDVYYIKTHSKDLTTEGGINLKKYYSMAKFISEEFVQCKQSKCSFERNDVIINYIITSPTFSENSLMLASFECESAATSHEKEKLAVLHATVNT